LDVDQWQLSNCSADPDGIDYWRMEKVKAAAGEGSDQRFGHFEAISDIANGSNEKGTMGICFDFRA